MKRKYIPFTAALVAGGFLFLAGCEGGSRKPPVQTAMAQPGSVAPTAPTSGIVQRASAVVPVGGQLVNPAGTMEAIAEDQGAQQAIYFEATDSQ